MNTNIITPATLCKCTRCRNVHRHDERVEVVKDENWFADVCPRCGAETFADSFDIPKPRKWNKIYPVTSRPVCWWITGIDKEKELEDIKAKYGEKLNEVAIYQAFDACTSYSPKMLYLRASRGDDVVILHDRAPKVNELRLLDLVFHNFHLVHTTKITGHETAK